MLINTTPLPFNLFADRGLLDVDWQVEHDLDCCAVSCCLRPCSELNCAMTLNILPPYSFAQSSVLPRRSTRSCKDLSFVGCVLLMSSRPLSLISHVLGRKGSWQ